MTDHVVLDGEDSGDEGTSDSLIERVRAQDPQAWARLVTLYTPLIHYWLGQQGLQPADQDDVTQEVFRAVERNIRQFRHEQPGDSFRSWLRVVTRSKAYDFRRNRHPENVGAGGSDAHGKLQQLPAPSDSDTSAGELNAERKLLYNRALAIIRSDFHEATWQAFWKYVVEDRRADDVAQELGIPPARVHTAKSRVLKRLREEFVDLIE